MAKRIESLFLALSHRIVAHPWLVITIALFVVGAVGSQIRHVTLDFTPESFLSLGHPERERYNAFRHQFGTDNTLVVAVRPDDPWSLEFLNWLRGLHESLESEVPYVDEVTSLINARVTRGDDDSLIVEDLMQEWPETPAQLAAVKARALDNPFYQNLLINHERRLVILLVNLAAFSEESAEVLEGFDDESAEVADTAPDFLTGQQRDEAVAALHTVVAQFSGPEIEIHVVGNPAVAQRTVELMQINMARFTGLAILSIMIVLAVLFRGATGVVLPLLVSVLSIVFTFGVAGIRGTPLSVTAQMIPSLLLAVSTSSTIHLLVMFFQGIDGGESRTDAIAAALVHSGTPIALASLTTAGALASFNAAELEGLRDVGILAPVGIAAGLVLCLTLLPALLAVIPARQPATRRGDRGPGSLERLLVRIGDFSTARPVAVITGATILVIGVGLGSLRLYYTFDALTFLADGDPLRESTAIINRDLAGVSSIEMLIDTGVESGLHDPVLLQALADLQETVRTIRGGKNDQIEVGKVISFIDILKEIHQALNENREEFYTVPDNRPLAAQELLLFENTGSDDLEDFVYSQFSIARMTLRVPWVSSQDYGNFLPETAALFEERLGEGIDVQVTGLTKILTVMQSEMKEGLIRSYTLALLIITPLMMLMIGSVRGGLVSMIPNLMPIVLVLGMMGWVGLELSVFTMMIGSIAIGLAVDDTIHFIHQFFRYRAITGNARDATRETMRTTGQALLTTSIVLSFGFVVFVFAEIRNLVAFGIVTTASIGLAFLADIIVSPALLALVSRGYVGADAASIPAEPRISA